MDSETALELTNLGIDTRTVPPGTVKLLSRAQVMSLGPEASRWALRPHNDQVLAYEIETEFKRAIGLVLRNLYPRKPEAAHFVVAREEKHPHWHNWTPALPLMWEMGVAVLVEGPKDARILHSVGLPALAYLSSTPSVEHLQALQKYVHTIVWVPDNEPLTAQVRIRREKVVKLAEGLHLTVRQPRFAAKDAGELIWKAPEQLLVLREKVAEIARISGGGYHGVGNEVPTKDSRSSHRSDVGQTDHSGSPRESVQG